MPRIMSRHKRAGFTLIELLVVIAIIAILAAILFPVFARARENARRASCQSNQKQILLGVAQYTQDYDEKYPPIFQNELSGTDQYAIWVQILQPYLKSTQIFQCPSDSSTTVQFTGHITPPGMVEPFHTSYMSNHVIGGAGRGSAISLSTVNSPSTTVYMCDGGSAAGSGGASNNSTTPTSTEKPGAWILIDPQTGPDAGSATGGDPNGGGPRVRHLETANVGFCDGHVKALKAEKFYYNNSNWLNPAVGGP